MVSTGKMLAFINALGSGSGPSEVVIMPETVLEKIEGTFVGATPLSNVPTDGATAVITYNGVEYTSPIIYVAQNAMFAMGNTEALGIQGGNADAPFMVALSPSGIDGQYASVMALDDATSVTISIVQVGAASGGGSASAGGGVFIVPATTADMQSVTVDKTPEEAMAAAQAGQHVDCHLAMSMGDMTMTYVLPLIHFDDSEYGAAVSYGMYLSGTSIEIHDGYSGNNTGTTGRDTTIVLTDNS